MAIGRPLPHGRRVALSMFHAAVAVLGLLGAACGGSRGRGDATSLETEDVTAKPDADASLEGDTVAREPAGGESLSGRLPGGFPRDVPVPRPASVVDFGPRSVTLEVQATLDVARRAYERRLRAAGFASTTAGGWSNGARSLGIHYEEHGGATWIRVEIQSGS